MKRSISTLICAGVATASFSLAPVAHSVEAGNTEGCTPGYWKVSQHHDSWQEGISPDHPLVDYYENAGLYGSTDDMTLLDALQGGGGKGLNGAARILARAAVAAYLNAAYDDEDGHLKYPWRRYGTGFNGEPPLVETVNEAFASGNRSTMIKLARQLDKANNLGCPLS